MLLTSGDDEDTTANPRPTVTTQAPTTDGEPTGEPSDKASDQPSDKPSDKETKPPSQEPTKNGNGGNTGGNGGNNGGNSGGNGNNEPTLGPVPQLPVYVFNQTTISGLAAQTASELSAGGWNVAGYDNWRGSVPEDTVYYYPGRRNAAVRLARQFPYIGRVWPATSPMPGGALTVILAETDRK